jgi:hypothetical protein
MSIFEGLYEIQKLYLEEILLESQAKENIIHSISTINGLNFTIPLTLSNLMDKYEHVTLYSLEKISINDTLENKNIKFYNEYDRDSPLHAFNVVNITINKKNISYFIEHMRTNPKCLADFCSEVIFEKNEEPKNLLIKIILNVFYGNMYNRIEQESLSIFLKVKKKSKKKESYRNNHRKKYEH